MSNPRRKARRLVPAIALVCVVSGAPAAALFASAVAPSAGALVAKSAPMCAAPGLVAWLNTSGSGAAGSTYYHLEFTNLTGSACSVTGYPGVSAVNVSGHQLGNAAGRDAAHKALSMLLAKGATVSATLQLTDAGNYPSARCAMTTAAGLRIFAPGNTVSQRVPYPFAACSRSGPVYLHVESVQATS